MTVDATLLAQLGLNANDPEVQEAWEDADAAARLVQTLVRARQAQGLTQRDVAQRMGTTQSAVSDLERTAGDPRLSTLQRFGRAVGLKIRMSVVAPTPQYVSHSVVQISRPVAPRPPAAVRMFTHVEAARAS